MSRTRVLDPLEERILRIESGLVIERPSWRREPARAPLAERMAHHNVPGVSVAVINNYRIEWARAYGVRDVETSEPVTAKTLFQAGSISKPVTALAVLRLVEEGTLSLDEDVNRYLKKWKVPPNGSWQPRVTLRQLLSHSAGTTVHGFPGYSRDETIPTLLQVLNGEPPSNTPPVYVDSIPGTHFRYSGGGTCIVQQLLEDVYGKPFPQLMRDLVLDPLDMQRSTFEQPLPENLWDRAATGHFWVRNRPVHGKWHVYPEMAAAGLWTTASDLARFVLLVQQAKAGKPGRLISKEMAEQMLTPQVADNMGLGLFLRGKDGSRQFGHGGEDHGFIASLDAYRDHGLGAVIMTNSYGGERLIQELRRAIAREYAWPDFLPPDRTPADVLPSAYDAYVGEYEFKPGVAWRIARDGDSLTLHANGQPPIPLFPSSETVFYSDVVEVELSFARNDKGQVTEMALKQNGDEIKLGRKR